MMKRKRCNGFSWAHNDCIIIVFYGMIHRLVSSRGWMTGIHVKHLLWWNAVWTLVSEGGYYIVMMQKNNELSLASLAAALDRFT